ncbi:MAG TPA: ABC transporter ATPase [Flavobacteriaceae bacterium]|nr:ABC transporter ATPase [Flavobacteriaceae bacterium]
MLVKFEELPAEARIWIYQANRPFTEEELSEIKEDLDDFIQDWTAHGADLKAGYDIRYRRFIIIGLDQATTMASGCSIDSSVYFIQNLEKKYDVDLLDKMNVSYKQGEFIAYKQLLDFKKMVKNRSVSENTIVFNNLVTNKEEYEKNWEVPLKESWHNRFL